MSVIIAVDDPVDWSPLGIESVLDQRLHAGELEVIAVASGAAASMVEDVARSRRGVRVVAGQPGGGAAVANAGIDHARGRYLYFMDPGDRLHPDHLPRLVVLAERTKADVVVPVSAGEDCGFRRPPSDRERVGLFDSSVYDDLGSSKLFRRGFLADWGLRFGSGDRVIGGRAFVAHTLVHARTVSIASGLEAVAGARPRSTRRGGDPAEAVTEVDKLALFLAQHFEPGERRDRLIRRHVEVEVVSEAIAGSWLDADEPLRARLSETAGAFLRRWLTPGVMAALPPTHRLIAHAVMKGDGEAVRELVRQYRSQATPEVLVESGRVFAVLPYFRAGADFPDELYDVTASLSPRHGMSVAQLDGDVLRLAGFAYLPCLDATDQTVTVLVRSADGGLLRRIPAEWTSTPDLTVRHGYGRYDYSRAGFAAAIDVAAIARAHRDDAGPLRLDIEVAVSGVVASAPLGTRRVRGLCLPRSSRLVGAADGAAVVRTGEADDGALRLDVSRGLADRVAVLVSREATSTGLTLTVRGDLVNLPHGVIGEVALIGGDTTRHVPALLERGDTGYLLTAKLPPPRLFLGRGVWRLGVRFRWADGEVVSPIRGTDDTVVTMIGRPSIAALLARITGRAVES
ncbi:glycosyltransferase [Stackebrandtia soli]|uniref:glycosyltransferase n=1 Tax=Stackebrandtia soli TaxID=1892856 RepID=UPI0039ECD47E